MIVYRWRDALPLPSFMLFEFSSPPPPRQDILIIGGSFKGQAAKKGSRHTPLLPVSATSLFRLAARSRVQPEQSSRGEVGGGEGRGGVEGMGGDHASLRFGDVTCCVVSGQALLRFLEARRRVLYVNEYNTSQFCHVCDQRVRQVSNRQVSLSTHPLALLLTPHSPPT